MISVLIPIFNFNVTNLVKEIHTQLAILNINFEIICIDDASTTHNFVKNNTIEQLNNVTFIKLNKNIGRSKIRNLLALKSKYNWLLFLDVDVIPKQQCFIKNYIDCINSKEGEVYVGGISYENIKPTKDRLLRWIYGKKREEVSFNNRKKIPYKYFFGGNFLISKTIFNSIKFDESLSKYGYEDVLFALSLKIRGINIVQVNNPIIHLGIPKTKDFLVNIEHSIENLAILCEKEILLNEVKILKVYAFLNRYYLIFPFGLLFSLLKPMLVRNLGSKNPKLFVLDFYKLGYLCFLKKN
ncbi:glycosyltransferase [Lutibacter sp.]|uniref:glycosyltransferase family 2 protein n=1 Tax=Lutibacter sp. TaxID=1925666 RepID=UPI0025B7C2C1|nr:glycosyltransferase [Lutibacter sp.]MCF6182060.1 glycosyltransferase [Lutibacter sp.]